MKDIYPIVESMKDKVVRPFGFWRGRPENGVYDVEYVSMKDLEGETVVIYDIEKVRSRRYNKDCVEMLIKYKDRVVGVRTSAQVFLREYDNIKRYLPVSAFIYSEDGKVAVEGGDLEDER